jgi:hypothetical protein
MIYLTPKLAPSIIFIDFFRLSNESFNIIAYVIQFTLIAHLEGVATLPDLLTCRSTLASVSDTINISHTCIQRWGYGQADSFRVSAWEKY